MDEIIESVAGLLITLNHHLDPLNVFAGFVCALLCDPHEFVLRKRLARRSPLAQLSQLDSELLPLLSPTNSPPSTRSHSPLPSCSPPRKPRVTRYWLAAFLVVVLLQIILIIRHTDIMAPFINIESAARRASSEASTLAVEKEKTEHEREAMAREEELWEKAKEKRVPQGAFWDTVWPAWDCRAYGKREYWGALRNIPEGWSDIDACMNMPVEIKGVTVRRPYRCAYVQGSPHIHGYWMVDWNQVDCKPWYRYPDFQDKARTNRPQFLARTPSYAPS